MIKDVNLESEPNLNQIQQCAMASRRLAVKQKHKHQPAHGDSRANQSLIDALEFDWHGARM